jgi:hypothetical protein
MECKGTFIGYNVNAMIVYFRRFYPDFEFFRHIPRIHDCVIINEQLYSDSKMINFTTLYSKFLQDKMKKTIADNANWEQRPLTDL